MKKEPNSGLPAYTTAENLIQLIDTLKKKSNNEEEVKALFGKGSSAYSNTKSALRAFGLIKSDSLDLTDMGRQAAFSQENEKKSEMTKVLIKYRPYEIFLLSLQQKSDTSITEIDEITNFWGKASIGSTHRNLEDAAKLFMGILDYCGFGKYITGRGTNATRIEWNSDGKKLIERIDSSEENLLFTDEELENPQEPKDNAAKIDLAKKQPSEGDTIVEPSTYRKRDINVDSVQTVITPKMVINVDMTDWPEEKMKAFFQYAYGKYEG